MFLIKVPGEVANASEEPGPKKLKKIKKSTGPIIDDLIKGDRPNFNKKGAFLKPVEFTPNKIPAKVSRNYYPIEWLI